jgi:hypothetical protein
LHRKKAELAVSAALLAIVILFLWEARDWQIRARLGPWTVGFAALAIALAQLYVAGRAVITAGKAERPARAPSAAGAVQAVAGPAELADATASGAIVVEEPPTGDAAMVRQKAVFIIVWTIGYCVGLWVLGFRLGAPMLVFGFLRFGAGESTRLSAWLALGAYLSIVLLFQTAVGLPFPPGLIFQAVGLQSPDVYVIDLILKAMRGGGDG